jgi:hypothetical protein
MNDFCSLYPKKWFPQKAFNIEAIREQTNIPGIPALSNRTGTDRRPTGIRRTAG